MQLNITTDYALRCLTYLAQNSGFCSSREISESIGVSREYLLKILRSLRKGGFVSSGAGKSGGYVLTRPASEITLLQVMRFTEDTMMLNRCLEPDRYCSRGAADYCNMRAFYLAMQDKTEDVLARVTIQDIVDGTAVC